MGDDFQQLFLDIVLKHVDELLHSSSRDRVKPLRLILLGTAGTGKTTTVQTTLQGIRHVLDSRPVSAKFVRTAAPTGCAAFNLRFNATTVHRLIHHFNVRGFRELDGEALARLQKTLQAQRTHM